MAARTLSLKLHRRELIVLPQRRRAPSRRGPLLRPELFDSVVPEPIVADLSSLLPLKVQVVGPKHPDYHQFQRYLAATPLPELSWPSWGEPGLYD
jgi:hypothetical protein